MSLLRAIFRILYICQDLLREALRFLRLMVSTKASLAAEVLFLRKQLAFYQERKIKPRRFDDSARMSMLILAKLFDWKSALVNVKPETFIGWHKQAFRLFWCWEIARRKATVAERHTAIDCRDGSQQSNLETGAGSGRTLAQAGNPGITANGEELLASRSGYRTAESLNPALDDLCAKPCKLCSRL